MSGLKRASRLRTLIWDPPLLKLLFNLNRLFAAPLLPPSLRPLLQLTRIPPVLRYLSSLPSHGYRCPEQGLPLSQAQDRCPRQSISRQVFLFAICLSRRPTKLTSFLFFPKQGNPHSSYSSLRIISTNNTSLPSRIRLPRPSNMAVGNTNATLSIQPVKMNTRL